MTQSKWAAKRKAKQAAKRKLKARPSRPLPSTQTTSDDVLDVFDMPVVANLHIGCARGYVNQRAAGTLHVVIEEGSLCESCLGIVTAMTEQDAVHWPEARFEEKSGKCAHCDKVHTALELGEDVDRVGVQLEHDDCTAWFALVDGELRLATSPKMCSACSANVRSWGRITSVIEREFGDGMADDDLS